MMLWRVIIILFSTVLIFGCASSNFNRQRYTDLKPLKTESIVEQLVETSEANYPAKEEATFASISEVNEVDFILTDDKTSTDYILDEDCGDLLTFKSGSFIEVKVIQVNVHDIVYRPCNDLNGPAFTVLKSELSQLRYQNGRLENLNNTTRPEIKEPVEESDPTNKTEIPDKEKPMEPFAIAALIFACTGFFWWIAIILGIVSLSIQKRNPDKFRKLSRTFALIGILLPLLLGFLAVVIILLLIFFW